MTDPISAVPMSTAGAAQAARPELTNSLASGSAPSAGPSGLLRAADGLSAFASQQTNGAGAVDLNRQLGAVERTLNASVRRPQDFLRQTVAMQGLTMQVSAQMTKLHLSTALAGSVSGLFNTLLKNRD